MNQRFQIFGLVLVFIISFLSLYQFAFSYGRGIIIETCNNGYCNYEDTWYEYPYVYLFLSCSLITYMYFGAFNDDEMFKAKTIYGKITWYICLFPFVLGIGALISHLTYSFFGFAFSAIKDYLYL